MSPLRLAEREDSALCASLSLLHVQSKVCMSSFHCGAKSVLLPFMSKFADFAPHMNGSNADFALHIEGSHRDFAPHMERRLGFWDQKIFQIAISA